MLTKEPSFASLLVKQSPAMHYGHGWIMGEDGKRWHPCHSQDELLSELTTRKRRKSKCMQRKVKWFISFVTEGKVIQYLKTICLLLSVVVGRWQLLFHAKGWGVFTGRAG